MRIGIDGRLIGQTGVGRYIRNLIAEIGELDTANQYIVYLGNTEFDTFALPNARWQKRLADVAWHSFREQVALPRVFLNDQLDLLHIPYFNIPIFYPKKFVVTIHDLIILHFPTGKASLLPAPVYWLKLLALKIILSVGLKKASMIIVPSEATKREIVEHFRIDPKKITVTYEGVDNKISNHKSQFSKKSQISKFNGKDAPYFLYVGNAYPHKNLEMLVRAFLKIGNPDKLIFVGKRDVFYERLQMYVQSLGLGNSVEFFGQADDTMLHALYQHAKALIMPSLMEGFGLPALEAASLGTPVVASDIPVFHEILGDYPLYFDPNNIEELITRLGEVKEKNIPQNKLHNQYSWETLGKKTMEIYLSCRT